jgi:hypothetical protein
MGLLLVGSQFCSATVAMPTNIYMSQQLTPALPGPTSYRANGLVSGYDGVFYGEPSCV